MAAGHAGCFNQALANNFGMIGLEASSIETSVEIDFGQDEGGHPVIRSSHITVDARVPGISEEQFAKCAKRSRINCTISRMLKIEIGITATLAP